MHIHELDSNLQKSLWLEIAKSQWFESEVWLRSKLTEASRKGNGVRRERDGHEITIFGSSTGWNCASLGRAE